MALGGMEMMLKSMGINPEEIKASIASFQNLAKEVSERQTRIETMLNALETKVTPTLNQIRANTDELLSRGQDVISKDDMLQHFQQLPPEEALKQREKPEEKHA